MLSPVQWNLWSALKIVLNFSCYAKFSFPHCSKVTRASQEKKKADCIQGEWRSSILTWLPVYLFFFQDFFFFFFKLIIFPLLTSHFLYQPLPWLGSRPSFLELYQFSSFVSSNHSSTLHLPWQEEEMAAPFLHACQCKILQRCSWNLLFPDLAPSIILLSIFNLSISTYSTLPTNAPLF